MGLRWRKPTAYPACRSNPPFARRLAGLCALRAPRLAHHPGERRRRYAQGKRAPCPSLALSADSPVRGQSVCRTALSADRTFAGQGVKKRGEPSAPSPAQAAEIDKMRRKIGAREIHNWRRARARAPHPVSQSVSSRAGPQGRVAPFRGCKARPDRRLLTLRGVVLTYVLPVCSANAKPTLGVESLWLFRWAYHHRRTPYTLRGPCKLCLSVSTCEAEYSASRVRVYRYIARRRVKLKNIC